MNWGSTWDFLWHFLIIFAMDRLPAGAVPDPHRPFWRDHQTSGFVKARLGFLPARVAVVRRAGLPRSPAAGAWPHERTPRRRPPAKQQTDDYIKQAAGRSPAQEIADAKGLLESGTITQAEFDALKTKALA